MTRFELWKQAQEQLKEAIKAYDQASATLKDIELSDLDVPGLLVPASRGKLAIDLDRTLLELQTAECDECGHAIAKHGDKYGCEYERGDVAMDTRDGGTVMAAAGPCGCQWWSKPVDQTVSPARSANAVQFQPETEG